MLLLGLKIIVLSPLIRLLSALISRTHAMPSSVRVEFCIGSVEFLAGVTQLPANSLLKVEAKLSHRLSVADLYRPKSITYLHSSPPPPSTDVQSEQLDVHELCVLDQQLRA